MRFFNNSLPQQVNLLLVFGVFGSLYKYSPLYRAFGFHHSQPAFIGLIIVMQFVFAPYNEVRTCFCIVRYKFVWLEHFRTFLCPQKYLWYIVCTVQWDKESYPQFIVAYREQLLVLSHHVFISSLLILRILWQILLKNWRLLLPPTYV